MVKDRFFEVSRPDMPAPDRGRAWHQRRLRWFGRFTALSFAICVAGAVTGHKQMIAAGPIWAAVLLVAFMPVETCPRCKGRLRPAAGWDERGREICVTCVKERGSELCRRPGGLL